MIDQSREVVQLSCLVHSSLFPELLAELNRHKIDNIHSYSGRMAILEDPRGLAVLLRSAGLASEPAEIIDFVVPIEQEAKAIALVSRSCGLHIPGRGSVYTKRLKVLQCNPAISLNEKLYIEDELTNGLQIFEGMMGVGCIVQRGLADDVVRMLLHIGVVPTVMHGSGTGIRDRLGLLRITLPKEKDLIVMVVGCSEADFITEKIILAGQLERPGRGFVYQTPVSKGIINYKTSNRLVGHAASVDQIIAAIDSVKGSFAWRQGSTGLDLKLRRQYMSGIEMVVSMNVGFASLLAREVMKLGITGATVLSPKVIRPSQISGERLLPARDVVRMMMPQQSLNSVLKICQDLDICGDGGESLIMVGEVPRAFTYQARSSRRSKAQAISAS